MSDPTQPQSNGEVIAITDKMRGHRDPSVSARQYGQSHTPAKKIIRAIVRFEDGSGAEVDVASLQLEGVERADIEGCVREALASGSELTIRGRVRKLRMSTPFGEKS